MALMGVFSCCHAWLLPAPASLEQRARTVASVSNLGKMESNLSSTFPDTDITIRKHEFPEPAFQRGAVCPRTNQLICEVPCIIYVKGENLASQFQRLYEQGITNCAGMQWQSGATYHLDPVSCRGPCIRRVPTGRRYSGRVHSSRS